MTSPTTDNSLRAGVRGPTLLEDFHLREKITRFDHERIPERVVHARGAGAHGYFEVYESLRAYTRASVFADPTRRTPVFVRFSAFTGSRGSADTPRDVRGFATKFYTDEGNFDLVGNNMPVFFIQDGIKFPDLVHAVKPEPHNEMPQASSAHDTFWDFVSLTPETMHHVIWLMSDRALPRGYAMMAGFGVHTFRLINAHGDATFVKFHWKPKLGVHSLLFDEARLIAGRDPDFHRRDLWDSIEAGNFPEFELGLQLIPEADEFAYGIDLLDPTKIIPEEVVAVTPVGRMVLDRNPANYFAETEQVAFGVGNLVPGIDVTDDPLLQARLFSYLDTQLNRLGGPDVARIPINRPVAAVGNDKRDGSHTDPTSPGAGCPVLAGSDSYVHYPEEVRGPKVRRRSETFADHYSQATLFWNSMADWERDHIVAAYRFELGRVTRRQIRELVVTQLNRIDHDLAVAVAIGIGVEQPPPEGGNHGRLSPALSQAHSPRDAVRGRKVAVLVADGVNAASVTSIVDGLTVDGAVAELLAPLDGEVITDAGRRLTVTRAMTTVSSVLYDAVVVPDGQNCAAMLASDGFAVHFIAEAYKHAKTIAGVGAGVAVLDQAEILGLAENESGPSAAGIAVDRSLAGESPDGSLGDRGLFDEGLSDDVLVDDEDLSDEDLESGPTVDGDIADTERAYEEIDQERADKGAADEPWADGAIGERDLADIDPAETDLTGVDEDLAGEVAGVGDITGEIDAEGLLDTGIVIDSEAGVDFLAALLAAIAAHRHYHRPLDAIAA